MTAGFALFLIDALLVAAAWPLTIQLALNGAGSATEYLQAALFVLSQLGSLYALGLYRREGISELDKALRRIPLVTALSVAASAFGSAILCLNVSVALCVAGFVCFAVSAVIARALFFFLRRHSLFRPHLLVIGAGKRAWDLYEILRSQGQICTMT